MAKQSYGFNRRVFLQTMAALGLSAQFQPANTSMSKKRQILKTIPVSAEKIPAIGMGSSITFDVDDKNAQAKLMHVLLAFFSHGGGLIDSSPMYGQAEKVLGDLLRAIPADLKENLFAATKVWVDGKQAGIAQMKKSEKLMGVPKFDLLQIHNLRDWQTHLETLQHWKSQKKVRYIGITTSHGRYHNRLESILKNHSFDFVQLSYNMVERETENRLIPLAAERKIAIIVNRPFQRGQLFQTVKGKKLPPWSKEFDCQSWGQFFLKYIISHPNITCAIPATSKVKHMIDNMQAAYGKLPDSNMRKKMQEYFSSL